MRTPPLYRTRTAIVALAAIAALAACASMGTASIDAQVAQMMKSSFRDQGIAKVDRLNQDRANEVCSRTFGAPPPEAQARAIEADNFSAVKMPSSGTFIGNWREGEKLAQSGRGMTWSDASIDSKDNGGNCYNCHQISKAEISYGTLGPSLYQYGKLRGVADPASAASRPIVEYTWRKLYNAKAFNACSEMPRLGAMLSEKQLQDIMALLLDPASPVNQ